MKENEDVKASNKELEYDVEDPERKAKLEIREEKLAIKAIKTEIVNSKRKLLSIKMQMRMIDSNISALQGEEANDRSGKTKLEIEAKAKELYEHYLCEEIPYLG